MSDIFSIVKQIRADQDLITATHADLRAQITALGVALNDAEISGPFVVTLENGNSLVVEIEDGHLSMSQVTIVLPPPAVVVPDSAPVVENTGLDPAPAPDPAPEVTVVPVPDPEPTTEDETETPAPEEDPTPEVTVVPAPDPVPDPAPVVPVPDPVAPDPTPDPVPDPAPVVDQTALINAANQANS